MVLIVPGCATTESKSLFRRFAILSLPLFLVACAAGPAQMSYPAFIQVDELPDVFIASMPGIRAKSLAGNSQTRRSSSRITLPPQWQFTTGASPGMSVEIFVLAGEIQLADLTLGFGGYAYLPAGSTGMQIETQSGALLLYFVDEADPRSVIQTPLIQSSDLLEWQPVSAAANDIGKSVKELRADPGSGARTWLLKTDPTAMSGWQQSTVSREGYLVAGSYQGSECAQGEVVTAEYFPGGYFHRPPGAANGGGGDANTQNSVWFMRVLSHENVHDAAGCGMPPGAAPAH